LPQIYVEQHLTQFLKLLNMDNTIFFNDRREFFNYVMSRNILDTGLNTFFGKFLTKANTGPIKEVVYDDDKVFLKSKLKKLNQNEPNKEEIEADLMQNHTYAGVKSLFIENLQGIYCNQAYEDGFRYVLKQDSCKTFNYRRYQDPESTAYVEINPATNYFEWVGYLNKSKKIKHRAKAVLELAIAYEDKERYSLDALLPTASKDSMCKYYESIGFEFDGFHKIPIQKTNYPSDSKQIPRYGASYSLTF
jgi:hypothetical protein